jgi:hypothetical protein
MFYLSAAYLQKCRSSPGHASPQVRQGAPAPISWAKRWGCRNEKYLLTVYIQRFNIYCFMLEQFQKMNISLNMAKHFAVTFPPAYTKQTLKETKLQIGA